MRAVSVLRAPGMSKDLAAIKAGAARMPATVQA